MSIFYWCEGIELHYIFDDRKTGAVRVDRQGSQEGQAGRGLVKAHFDFKTRKEYT